LSKNIIGYSIQEITSTFSFSNINHSILHYIQKDLGNKEKKILRYVPTRWLSLGNCVDHILEEWEALMLFFEQEKNKSSFIVKSIQNPKTKAQLQFLAYFFKKFNVTQKLFQDDTSTSYLLYEELRGFYLSICRTLLKSNWRKSLNYEKAFSIDLENNNEVEIYFMDTQECYQNVKKERFKTQIEWDNLSENQALSLVESFREFILEVLHKCKHYLPLSDSYIDLFKVLRPDAYDRECWLELSEKFPLFLSGNDYTTIIGELDLLEHFEFEKLNNKDSLFQRWNKINEDIKIPVIATMAQTLLSIPISSASIERTFSQLRLIQNHLRTNLSDETLEACLLIHQNDDLEITPKMVKALDEIHFHFHSFPTQSISQTSSRKACEDKKEEEEKKKKRQNKIR